MVRTRFVPGNGSEGAGRSGEVLASWFCRRLCPFVHRLTGHCLPHSLLGSFHILLIPTCCQLQTSLGIGFVFFSVSLSSTILRQHPGQEFPPVNEAPRQEPSGLGPEHLAGSHFAAVSPQCHSAWCLCPWLRLLRCQLGPPALAAVGIPPLKARFGFSIVCGWKVAADSLPCPRCLPSGRAGLPPGSLTDGGSALVNDSPEETRELT